MTNIYEAAPFRNLPDGAMHPGGLRLTDRAVRLAGLRAGMRAADIGCGTGATVAHLEDKYKLNAVGLELSPKLIDIGRARHPGLRLFQGDCTTLPFEDESLDVILFECTLSVIGNTAQRIAQVAKALTNGGIIIISDLCATEEGHPLPTANQLCALLLSAGFQVLLQEDHTDALRTYRAQLRDCSQAGFDACLQDSLSCCISGLRWSALGYTLFIAQKV